MTVNADAPGAIAARGRGALDPGRASLDRLRLRRREGRLLRRGRSGRADQRLWPLEARRRGRGPRGQSAASDPAHLLGLQRARHEFRAHHAAAGRDAATRCASSPTSTAARPPPPTSPQAIAAACPALLAADATLRHLSSRRRRRDDAGMASPRRSSRTLRRAACAGRATSPIATADYPTRGAPAAEQPAVERALRARLSGFGFPASRRPCRAMLRRGSRRSLAGSDAEESR